MRFKRVTENNTLIPAILGALDFYREQVYAFRVEAEGRRGLRRLMPKGTADILGVVRTLVGHGFTSITAGPVGPQAVGRAFAIETKGTHGLDCGRKKCSCVDQREWRKDWERCGGLYILADTAQQAVNALLDPVAAMADQLVKKMENEIVYGRELKAPFEGLVARVMKGTP